MTETNKTARQIIEEGRPGSIVNVQVIEWWDILTAAEPPADKIKAQVLADLRLGCERCIGIPEVGILADQGRMVLAMLPPPPAPPTPPNDPGENSNSEPSEQTAS